MKRLFSTLANAFVWSGLVRPMDGTKRTKGQRSRAILVALAIFLGTGLFVHAAEINDLNNTDASNTGRFPEGMNPSAVNDGARALEGMLSRGLKATIDGCTTTAGVSTAYTLADPRTISALYDGLTVCAQWHTASGASPTLAVDGLTATALEWPDGTAVASGDLPSGGRSLVTYDGTQFQVLTLNGQPSSVTAASTTTFSNKTIDSASNTVTVDLSEATVTGTTAEFNTALSDGSFATLAGTETLASKTLTDPIVDGTDLTVNTGAGTDANITEGGVDVNSASAETWNVQNAGAGAMTLQVDGVAVPTISSTSTFTNKTFDANGSGNSLSNVDVADLANGTDGELITWSAAGAPTTVAVGTSGQVLTSNGAGAAPTFQDTSGGFTEGTEQATTSGADIDFTGIPSGTTQITIMLEGVGSSGGQDLELTLGDSGGFEVTGYVSMCMGFRALDTTPAVSNNPLSPTDAFAITNDRGTSDTVTGYVTISLKDAANNTWQITGGAISDDGNTWISSGITGSKSLSGELTQIRLSYTGSDTFNAGSANIIYQ